MKTTVLNFIKDILLDDKPIFLVGTDGQIIDGYIYEGCILKALEDAHQYFQLSENQFLVVG